MLLKDSWKKTKPPKSKIPMKTTTDCAFQWLYYFAWCNDKHAFELSLDHQLCLFFALHVAEEHAFQSWSETKDFFLFSWIINSFYILFSFHFQFIQIYHWRRNKISWGPWWVTWMFVFLDLSKIEPPVTLWVSIFMHTVSEAVHFVFVLCRPGYMYLFCFPLYSFNIPESWDL